MAIDSAKLRAAREAKGWSQDELASRAGVSQTAIHKIESGVTRRSKFLPRIAQVLEIAIEQLDSDFGLPVSPSYSSGDVHSKRAPLTNERHLPIFGAAEAGLGAMILTKDPVDFRPLPSYLATHRDAYGVYIIGDSMSPRYEPGEIAEVSPHRPRKPNCDVILYKDHDGEESAIIKRLISWTDTEWTVCQFTPPKTYKLDRREWTRCHVVVGRSPG